MRDDNAKGNQQTATWISHNLTQNNNRLFLPLMYWQRINVNDILWKRDVELSRHTCNQTWQDSAYESKNEPVTSDGVHFRLSSKAHPSWLWLVLFDPFFFQAEKPPPGNLYIILYINIMQNIFSYSWWCHRSVKA